MPIQPVPGDRDRDREAWELSVSVVGWSLNQEPVGSGGMGSALAWHKAPTGGSLPPECDSPALPLQGPAINPAAQRRDKEMQSRTQSVPLGGLGAWAPPPAHLYSPKVSSFMGRASESTWISSLSFTADTEQAQLLTLPHHPARPQAHGPSPSHTQCRQLPSGHLPAAPSMPMLSCPGSGTERGGGTAGMYPSTCHPCCA